MSAGVCGKRLGFEEIFGSPSAASAAPSAKRSRCSGYGSPVRSSEFGFGSEDKVSVLLRMFPSMEREVVEAILNSHNHKIDDAIKSLHALCLGDGHMRNGSLVLGSTNISSDCAIEGCGNAQSSEQNAESFHRVSLDSESRMPQDGSSWVDIFVQEMMNAANWDDVRDRATKILEAFEKNVITNCRASEEQEIASLKDQLQSLLRDNQILKRAVAIQHERNLEHEEKLKEVEQLKHIIGQYQEQVRSLELNNYTLKMHLQRAQEASSIPSHFHPDIF